MKTPLLHPRTGAAIRPIGYRKNGRAIYPILGGSPTLLENLTQQWEADRALVQGITVTAAEQNRSLSDQDTTTIKAKQEHMRSLQEQIDLLKEQEELAERSASNLSFLNRSPETSPIEYGTVGELIRERLDAVVDPTAATRYRRTMERAAQHMGTTAANTVPTAGGMPGLLIQQNKGPVIDLSPKGRPLLAALGVTTSTDPLSFRRPRLIDSNFTSGVGVQAKEKAELASGAFNIEADTVNLVTIGGYLNISAQLQAMPIGALDISYAQLRSRVENATERAAITALLDQADASIPLAANASAAQFLNAVYRASAKVYAETGQLATWIAMGPEGWARLGAFVDGDDRPYFPTLGAANAAGTASATSFTGSTIAGLQPVVTHGLTGDNADDFVVGNAMSIEAYEYRFPLFQSQEPSVLGTQIAVAVAFGTYRPVAGGAVVLRPAPVGAARSSAAADDKK